MTHDDINKVITQTIAIVFDLKYTDIRPETSSKTVDNWDSLNQIKLIIALEEELGFEFEPEEIAIMTSYHNIFDIINKKLILK